MEEYWSSTQIVNFISLILQHFSTSDGHCQGSNIKNMKSIFEHFVHNIYWWECKFIDKWKIYYELQYHTLCYETVWIIWNVI